MIFHFGSYLIEEMNYKVSITLDLVFKSGVMKCQFYEYYCNKKKCVTLNLGKISLNILTNSIHNSYNDNGSH